MNLLYKKLFPERLNQYPGRSRLPVTVFVLIALVSTLRSCIHLFAPDGGAGSIAGLDLTVPGAEGIVFAFGLWGSSQLIAALIQLLAAFRYRGLIPLMYLLLIVEVLLRELVGAMKPVSFAHTPPGAVGNWVILPLAVVMLVLSLWEGKKSAQQNGSSIT
ncbi:MAG: hypothetical protein HY835_03135 [Anaerolineae bacterium]|nr:hypothetical protein [Anaerolineae bacterium]